MGDNVSQSFDDDEFKELDERPFDVNDLFDQAKNLMKQDVGLVNFRAQSLIVFKIIAMMFQVASEDEIGDYHDDDQVPVNQIPTASFSSIIDDDLPRIGNEIKLSSINNNIQKPPLHDYGNKKSNLMNNRVKNKS